jgi:hypothetical protein
MARLALRLPNGKVRRAALQALALLGAASGVQEIASLPDFALHDFHGALADSEPLHTECQRALKEAAWREERGLSPVLHADSLHGVQLGPRARAGDPRIAYFVGVSRPTAHIMVSRLLLALYHISHLFLLHADAKTSAAAVEELRRVTADHPNVHLMRTRRRVQWGAWTMVVTMLDAMHTLVSADVDFEFFINLSDVDVALRTNDEMLAFLRPHIGRQFVEVHLGTGEWLEKARNFTSAHVVVECEGHGFVALNSSRLDLGQGPMCCFGRGGPVLYANTSVPSGAEARQAVLDDAANNLTRMYTGSQWVVLDRGFTRYLVRDPQALRWQRVFERRFLSDESFVQTALMHSPHRGSAVRANLRYIYWPHYDHADPTAYWARLGPDFIGGPQVINASEAAAVFRSPYAFARKVEPAVDSDVVRAWDVWMRAKLARVGGLAEGQAPLGGEARAQPADVPVAAVAVGADGSAARWPSHVSRRTPGRLIFDDGSSCECPPLCVESGTCCDRPEHRPELCEPGGGTGGAAGKPPLHGGWRYGGSD